MKKGLHILPLCLLLGVLSGCAGNDKITDITISASKDTITIGETIQLSASITPDSFKIEDIVFYVSSGDEYINQSGNTVKGIKEGQAKVRAKSKSDESVISNEISITVVSNHIDEDWSDGLKALMNQELKEVLPYVEMGNYQYSKNGEEDTQVIITGETGVRADLTKAATTYTSLGYSILYQDSSNLNLMKKSTIVDHHSLVVVIQNSPTDITNLTAYLGDVSYPTNEIKTAVYLMTNQTMEYTPVVIDHNDYTLIGWTFNDETYQFAVSFAELKKTALDKFVEGIIDQGFELDGADLGMINTYLLREYYDDNGVKYDLKIVINNLGALVQMTYSLALTTVDWPLEQLEGYFGEGIFGEPGDYRYTVLDEMSSLNRFIVNIIDASYNINFVVSIFEINGWRFVSGDAQTGYILMHDEKGVRLDVKPDGDNINLNFRKSLVFFTSWDDALAYIGQQLNTDLTGLPKYEHDDITGYAYMPPLSSTAFAGIILVGCPTDSTIRTEIANLFTSSGFTYGSIGGGNYAFKKDNTPYVLENRGAFSDGIYQGYRIDVKKYDI